MGRCPRGTLSAPITPIRYVLQHGHEWKNPHTHTAHTFINTCWHPWITEEMLLLSLHLLFFTSLEAVNWKDGPFLASFKIVLPGNDLWIWGSSFPWWRHFPVDLEVTTKKKERNRERDSKERKKMTPYVKAKNQWSSKTLVKLALIQTNAAGLFSLLGTWIKSGLFIISL